MPSAPLTKGLCLTPESHPRKLPSCLLACLLAPPAGWIWWRQRKQRDVGSRKSGVPQKVTCVYDWTPQIPQVCVFGVGGLAANMGGGGANC